MFLRLSSPDLAVERVAQRVAQGGHNIPEDTISRRYYTGLKISSNTIFLFAITHLF
jgi:predicted ABC-type ATPase